MAALEKGGDEVVLKLDALSGCGRRSGVMRCAWRTRPWIPARPRYLPTWSRRCWDSSRAARARGPWTCRAAWSPRDGTRRWPSTEGTAPIDYGCREIPVEGPVEFGGWRISSREARFDAVDAARAGVAYLDGGRGPYGVRLAREGDVIRPLGLGGTKKVLRAMMDRKVPSDLRRRTPVVVGGGGEVAWIVGGELGEGFKVGETTEKILRLEVERLS